MTAELARTLDAALPQTQCRRCGYPGCADYANAMAAGDAGPERCPPGGDAVASALAAYLDVAARPVDRALGEVAPWRRAVIVEADCIGCTRCIAACPVDAIIGGAKLMHAVVDDECTGCDLCLPACPVDCIEMHAAASWTPAGPLDDWFVAGAPRAKARFMARRARGDTEGIRRATRTSVAAQARGPSSEQERERERERVWERLNSRDERSPRNRDLQSLPQGSSVSQAARRSDVRRDAMPPAATAPRTAHETFLAAALARAKARRQETGA